MIKLYAFLIFCLSTTTFAYGQFDKGQKVVGGNIGLSVGKSDNMYNNNYTSDYSNVSVNPSLAWFSKPGLLTGIGLSYGYNNQKNKSNISGDVNQTYKHFIGLNIFSQKFIALSQNFFFTVNANGGLTYTFGKQNNDVNNLLSQGKSSGYSIGFSLAPGLSYKLTQRLLFDANLSNLISISYSYNKNEVTTEVKTFDKSFAISSSLSNTSLGSIGLGFRWLLKRK